MNLTKARELRETRGRKYQEARALYDGSKRTKEDVAKFNAAMDECDALKAQIDAEERMEATDKELRGGAPPNGRVGAEDPKDALQHVQQFRTALRRHRRTKMDPRSAFEVIPNEIRATLNRMHDEYWAATRAYLIGGDANLSPEARAILNGGREEFRALGVGSVNGIPEYRDMGTGGGNALQGTGGGYFVPVGFVDDIEEALKWYGDMFKSSTIMETATGQPLPYPTDNDTSNTGVWIGEGVQVTETDITPGSITFNAWKLSTGLIKVSIELLQDSAFDLETYVKERFAVRIGRAGNTGFTTGAGKTSSLPNGILIAATTGPTAVGSSGNDGGAETGGTSIGTDDLIELEHSVDPAYRRGAAFMAHDSTIKLIKKLKDKYGRPLWLPGIAAGTPDTINGYEYFVNNDLPTVAINAKTVLFGDLKKYVIRQVKELAIVRLNERYMDYGQVGFVGFARYDGNLLDAGTHPVKYLVQAAS